MTRSCRDWSLAASLALHSALASHTYNIMPTLWVPWVLSIMWSPINIILSLLTPIFTVGALVEFAIWKGGTKQKVHHVMTMSWPCHDNDWFLVWCPWAQCADETMRQQQVSFGSVHRLSFTIESNQSRNFKCRFGAPLFDAVIACPSCWDAHATNHEYHCLWLWCKWFGDWMGMYHYFRLDSSSCETKVTATEIGFTLTRFWIVASTGDRRRGDSKQRLDLNWIIDVDTWCLADIET
jgi:hypothetical protein